MTGSGPQRHPAAEDPTAPILLDTLLGTLEQGILFLDPEFRVLQANQAFMRLTGLGLTPGQLVGTRLAAGPATYPHLYRDPTEWAERVTRLHREGHRVRDEPRELTDGRTLFHTYAPATISGTTVGHLWVLSPQHQDPSNQVPGSAPAGSRSGDPTWHDLAATIAHEARTPATSLVTYATMLDDPDLDPTTRHQAAQAVCRGADRILLLASDLLLYANLGLDVQAPADCPVNLIGLIRSIVATVDPPIPVKISPGPLTRGEETQLRMAISGIIGVATLVADGQPLLLEAACPSGSWVVSVSAPAPAAISQEFLISSRIPTPGVPGSSRSAAFTLLLASAVARHHGGSCRLNNEPGQCRIVFHLPSSGFPTTDL